MVIRDLDMVRLRLRDVADQNSLPQPNKSLISIKSVALFTDLTNILRIMMCQLTQRNQFTKAKPLAMLLSHCQDQTSSHMTDMVLLSVPERDTKNSKAEEADDQLLNSQRELVAVETDAHTEETTIPLMSPILKTSISANSTGSKTPKTLMTSLAPNSLKRQRQVA